MQNSKLDRAKQFMPFAALRGYYDLIKEKERIKEPKRELLDEDANKISEALNKIKKGMMIKLKYYNKDAYDEITGIVSSLDETCKTLTIVKTKVCFDDILDIKILINEI